MVNTQAIVMYFRKGMLGKDKTEDSREERDLTKDNKDEEKNETMDTNENGCD